MNKNDYIALVLAAVTAAGCGNKKEAASNVIYKGEISGSQVTYEVNDNAHKLTMARDGLTWIIQDDGDRFPDIAIRIQGSSRTVFDNDTGAPVPKEAKDLYRNTVTAIEDKINQELKELGKVPVQPVQAAPAQPAVPAPALVPNPAPTPADPAVPTGGASSADYARFHYRNC